jgi:hypothetical protein
MIALVPRKRLNREHGERGFLLNLRLSLQL